MDLPQDYYSLISEVRIDTSEHLGAHNKRKRSTWLQPGLCTKETKELKQRLAYL